MSDEDEPKSNDLDRVFAVIPIALAIEYTRPKVFAYHL